ncbi:hypothetical protein [Fervidibacter sacchari]
MRCVESAPKGARKGGLWAWRQHSTHAYEERTRQEVEQELYKEGELGHLPGQVPAQPPTR